MITTKIVIDGTEIDVPAEYTLLQACEAAGIEIPRFCYHDRLSIAGNCRMCLVEVKGGPPKPAASCAMNVRDLRAGPNGEPPEIFTKTPMVKKAREGVMEFLLINHPLDCPICDQGGECDLQDQAMAYGVDASRFAENKRAVEDKYIGPLVKTIMTRCIACTRCVRFVTEVAGVAELGLTGRGEDVEITTYLEEALTSELQGNIIDLCPVGALTSKPYAFKARPWELSKTETIDVMDALGAAIRVDARGREVMRILPRTNDAVNEEWISDKSRFIWDGLRTQRLDRPYVRQAGRLGPVGWREAFALIAERVAATSGTRMAAIAGDLASVEEMFALKSLMQALGSPHVDCRQNGIVIDSTLGAAGYRFNTTIAGIDKADAVLLIGSNPRREAPVLNARLRRLWMSGVAFARIGPPADLTYSVETLGAGPQTLTDLIDNRLSFAEELSNAEHPLIVIGEGALARPDGGAVLASAAMLAERIGAVTPDWNGFNVLHTRASGVGGLAIGFTPGDGGFGVAGMHRAAKAGDIDIVFLLGADEIDTDFGDASVVYIGSHGDRGAHAADVILPGAAYTEKSATYLNTEGRVQLTTRAVFPPGDAREDWAILRALSAELGATLPFDSLSELRARLYEANPAFAAVGEIAPNDDDGWLARLTANAPGTMDTTPFSEIIADFYLTNPIARASKTMAECSALARSQHLAAAE